MNMNELENRYLAAKRRLFDIYYDSLNAPQKEAVYTADGALLVLKLRKELQMLWE